MSSHPGASGSTEFIRLTAGEEEWEPAYELGLEACHVHGSQDESGIYVVRLKWPKYVMTLPHSHPEDRHIQVVSGTWYTGTGDVFDPSTAVALGPGDYMLHPAGMVHWDGSKDEETVIHVTGFGPSAMYPTEERDHFFTRIDP